MTPITIPSFMPIPGPPEHWRTQTNIAGPQLNIVGQRFQAPMSAGVDYRKAAVLSGLQDAKFSPYIPVLHQELAKQGLSGTIIDRVRDFARDEVGRIDRGAVALGRPGLANAVNQVIADPFFVRGIDGRVCLEDPDDLTEKVVKAIEQWGKVKWS